MLAEIITLMESGHLAEAEDAALAHVGESPEDSQCWSLLVVLAAQRGDLSLAIERSDRTLEIAPTDVRAWLNRGNLERLRSNRAEAVRAYEQVLELSPGHDSAGFNLAALAEEEERWTEAEARYRSILARHPGHAETLYNLARLLGSEPHLREEEAIDLYARSLAVAPFHIDAWRNRAHLLRRVGRDAGAIESYRRVLELDPEDTTCRHLLAALEGVTPASAEPEYVTGLFDRFAPTYDHDFGERLGYEGATRLAADLLRVIGDSWDDRDPVRVLDLGCGTGLFLEQLLQQSEADGKPRFAAMGVDLSPEMLARAEAKEFYERLDRAEAVTWLRGGDSLFDLVALADVLIYVGDPAPLLDAAASRLGVGAFLAFTVELADSAEESGAPSPPGGSESSVHLLRRTGRFAHREQALRALVAERGYEVRSWQRGPLRREKGEILEGLCVVARRADEREGQP